MLERFRVRCTCMWFEQLPLKPSSPLGARYVSGRVLYLCCFGAACDSIIDLFSLHIDFLVFFLLSQLPLLLIALLDPSINVKMSGLDILEQISCFDPFERFGEYSRHWGC